MDQIVLAFITGLTTGGLSCLAVQGGLLASSIAHDVELSVQGQPARGGKPAAQQRASRPILLFLAAKLIAYTILGFLLGLLGSVLQLTPTMRAILLAAIGVFMVGTALRMLNIHPIFRYFALEPPAFVTRYIRRKAKGQASAVTPLFLGALTVLIPCGVTQAMMAVAMGVGDPVRAATMMFAFTLGTSPVFFTVAYLATRLGARLEKNFMRIVALMVLVLGLISIDSGLTLAGWPFSVANLRMAAASAGIAPSSARLHAEEPLPALDPPQNAAPAQGAGELTGAFGPPATASNAITINVANSGYRPKISHAKPDQPLQLSLVSNETYTCALAFVIQSLGVEKMLPSTGRVVIDIPPQAAGSKLFYSCSMGMYSGVIVFDG